MKPAPATLLLAALALAACADDPGAPIPAAPAGIAASASIGPTCPCWDAEALLGALPETDACVDQTAAEVPFLSVDLFDPSAATQTQAFTRYDGGSAEAGSCRLAVVGTAGLVTEISAASGLPRTDYEGCSALLLARARATAAGC
jgi:hypothetical protein